MLYLLILPSKYIHINIQNRYTRIYIAVLFVNNPNAHQHGKCKVNDGIIWPSLMQYCTDYKEHEGDLHVLIWTFVLSKVYDKKK